MLCGNYITIKLEKIAMHCCNLLVISFIPLLSMSCSRSQGGLWEVCTTVLFIPNSSVCLPLLHPHSYTFTGTPTRWWFNQQHLTCTVWQHLWCVYEVPILGNSQFFHKYVQRHISKHPGIFFTCIFSWQRPNMHPNEKISTCWMHFESLSLWSFQPQNHPEAHLHTCPVSPAHLCPVNHWTRRPSTLFLDFADCQSPANSDPCHPFPPN